MDQGLGLRARKKQRTRANLIEQAMVLFAEQGYEQTTVAEIAAAADVSTRTFFSYFASKEDVIFGDDDLQLARFLHVIAERSAELGMVDVLVCAIDEVLDDVAANRDEALLLAPAVLRLVVDIPALQSAALRRVGQTQRAVVDALLAGYPNQDPLDVSIAVGSLFGALHAASVTSLRRGDPPQRVLAVARRAIDVAVAGLRATVGG